MSEAFDLTTFKSADGTLRCLGCGLHADLCTCDPSHPMWDVLVPLVDITAPSRLSNLIGEGGNG